MTFLTSTNPVVTISGIAPVLATEGVTPVISIQDSTIEQKGAVQLEDSVVSTSTTKAATPNSVRNVQECIATTSGTLQDSIDSKSGTLLELSDTPGVYDDNKYLCSTVDGTVWSTVSGINTFLDLVDTPITYTGHSDKYLKVSSDELGIEFVSVSGVASTIIDSWSVYDESIYYADFEHNLNTDEISVFIVDTDTNKAVGVEDIEILSVNVVRVYIENNTSSLKVNIVTGGFGTTGGTTPSHNELDNLDYVSAGHTGFQQSGDYITDSELTSVSGVLQSNIDSVPTSLITLSDTPDIYDNNKYLRSTVDGFVLSTISGVGTFLDLVDTPVTYSGSALQYLKVTSDESGVEYMPAFRPDNIIYVAKNGSDLTIDGNSDSPFLTIEAANNYAISLLNPVTDWNECIIVKIAPGVYTEKLTNAHRRVYIIGNTTEFEGWSKDVIIYNTGADEDHYPIDVSEWLNLIGVEVLVDAGGVYGRIINKGIYSLCGFENGHFINNPDVGSMASYFNFCYFTGDGFRLEGTNDGVFITFRRCDIDCENTIFGSTSSNGNTIKISESLCSSNVTISGNCDIILQNSELYAAGTITFDTDGYIDIYNTIIVNGLEFISDTSGSKKIINSYFKDVTNYADIISGVDILDFEYINNSQDKGLSGNIKITNKTKYVGPGVANTYMNVTEALMASSSGDVVNICAGTYNENINIKEGVSLVGASKEYTFLTSNSGTLLTNIFDSHSHIRDCTFISTASGIDDVHIIDSTAGTLEFTNCSLKVDLVDMYTDAILITDSNFILNNTDVIYTQTGTTTGSGILHQAACFYGSSSFVWKSNSFTSMTINDSNSLASASMCETIFGSDVNMVMGDSEVSFVSQNPSWGGNAYAMKVGGTLSSDVKCNDLTVTVIGSGGAGSGYSFYFDTTDNNGIFTGSLNIMTTGGFTKNYVCYVGEGDTFNSHFDMLYAVDVAHGPGELNYVTSPTPGNLQISGYIFNPFDNIIKVAKSGAQYTSIKDALDSITDSNVFNRYTVLIGPGIFIEDNPIQLKPWVSLKSIATKEITMISPQDVNSDLLTGCDRSYISNVVLSGITSGKALSFEDTGLMTVKDIILVDNEYGIHVNNADAYIEVHNLFVQTYTGTIKEAITVVSGTAQIRGVTVVGDSIVETIIKSDAGNMSVFNLWSESTNLTNGLVVDNGGELFAFSGRISNAANGLRIGSNGGKIEVSSAVVENSSSYDLLIESSSGIFVGNGCSLNRDKLSIATGASINNFGYDKYANVDRILGEFAVGRDGLGSASRFGEGGSYEHGVKVKTFDGSNYHTLTTQSGISFPNTTSGTCIYIGSDSIFCGLRYTLTSGMVPGAGSIVCEYYDGNGSWLTFNTQNTIEHYSDIVAPFTAPGESYTLRFDQNINTGIYESDVTASGIVQTSVDGVNGYWIRGRIVDNITSSHEFTSIRLKGNYTIIRTNGSRAYNGEARVEEIKELVIGATSAGTADESLSISQNILFPYTQNEMATVGSDEAVYSRFIIPSDCDLSCGLSYTYEVTNVDSPASDGIVHLTVTMAGITGNDKFDGTINEHVVDDSTLTVSATDTAWKIWREISNSRFDLSSFVPGDVIYCKLHRPNDTPDTYASSMCLSNHYMEYRSWQDGISNKYV